MTKAALFTLLLISSVPLSATTDTTATSGAEVAASGTLGSKPIEPREIELSSACKTYYPDRMGLSPNESLLSLFQTIPGLMNTDESGISDNISLKVDNESHIFDVNSVLRRIRVMDVSRIEIVNNPDAMSGTSGLGISVHVFLKRLKEGLHGNVALDYNTNGTIDPTMHFGWKKGRWAIYGGASLYFDRSKTTTTSLKRDLLADSTWNETNRKEVEKADSYGESANLTFRFSPTRRDKITLGVSQNHIKVKTWITTETLNANGLSTENSYEKNKQSNNSLRFSYGHDWNNASEFRFSGTAKYQDNPRLYNYQNYGVNNKRTENANTGSNTKALFLEASQKLPLWKNAFLQVGEKYDNSIINDLTKIKIGDNSTYYDITSANSQTKAQIDWLIGNWDFQLGEVLDYFHYTIGITGLPDKENSTITPQTYVSAGYKINLNNRIHASYRTGLSRPNYRQIYPISTAIDIDQNYVLQDSLFRKLNNSKVHTFNIGHVYHYEKIAISTNFKTILINDLLTCVNKVWKNSDRNNIYRLYSCLVWSPKNFTTAISASANLLSYKYTETSSYDNKHSFDLRWLGTYNLPKNWNVGANIQYNGPVWYSYSKIEDYVWAEAHVTKTLGKWSFNASFSDILDMQIKTKKQTETSYEEIAEERDYQGFSVGVSYKF